LCVTATSFETLQIKKKKKKKKTDRGTS
jgi:hypothetical protein